MADSSSIKEILRSHRLAPNRDLGQNFLTNRQVAARIVDESGIGVEDTAIELGVGLASLTLPLAAKARRVIGLEVDRGIVDWHAQNKILPTNVTLLHQDLLLADFKSLAEQFGRLKILANLPYSISSPLLIKLLDNAPHLEWAVLMLQKEMALRLTAVKSTKQYGILTVLFAPFAEIRQLFSVGPGNFHPKPKVDSSVIRISFHPPPALLSEATAVRTFRKLVRTAFQQRRKTLLNSLSGSSLFPGGKEEIARMLQTLAIDSRSRPESLDAGQFLALTELLCRPVRQLSKKSI